MLTIHVNDPEIHKCLGNIFMKFQNLREKDLIIIRHNPYVVNEI